MRRGKVRMGEKWLIGLGVEQGEGIGSDLKKSEVRESEMIIQIGN